MGTNSCFVSKFFIVFDDLENVCEQWIHMQHTIANPCRRYPCAKYIQVFFRGLFLLNRYNNHRQPPISPHLCLINARGELYSRKNRTGIYLVKSSDDAPFVRLLNLCNGWITRFTPRVGIRSLLVTMKCRGMYVTELVTRVFKFITRRQLLRYEN